ncbi:zinc-binding dehydrogenase [Nonomuraea longicatena]|uniref:Zinc-binding dehydrogenase n=1 Tax=Nonomuraea longicatena TaxID=83682 RepID=A0ABP3Z997_9ACTN
MRAIQVHQFGGPDVLVPADLPDPTPGPGQVVVRLAAADVIFLDTLLRGGWGGDYFPLKPPYVPGGGGAGRVVAVGDGVDPDWIGRRVLARSSAGYAELITTTVVEIVELPDDIDFPEAAAMLHDGVTALLLREAAGEFPEGTWVLVTSAAGGAGSLLVQLLRASGARVIAAARGERKLNLARELGAEAVVDYSEAGWQTRVREATGGAGAHIVYDGAGGELGRAAFEAVADGGLFLTYGTSNEDFTVIDPKVLEARRVDFKNLLEEGSPDKPAVNALMTEALRLTAKGDIRPAIGATFPLERAAEAHASLEARNTVGKSLLLIT